MDEKLLQDAKRHGLTVLTVGEAMAFGASAFNEYLAR